MAIYALSVLKKRFKRSGIAVKSSSSSSKRNVRTTINKVYFK